MRITELKEEVSEGRLDQKLISLYGEEHLLLEKKRYIDLLLKAQDRFGDQEAHLFSAPGRTEVGGNHTDHQLGKVLAAPIHLDALAVVIPTGDDVITYDSEAFHVKPIDLIDLSIHEEEKNTTEALIRGIAARFAAEGKKIGGFEAYAQSDVLPGSGMSSSAAFEILIAHILNVLYNDGTISPVEEAKTGQYAENVYFGKASGLLDQMACSVGGFIAIDFKDKENPAVRKVDFDFGKSGYEMILTDCKQSHSDLSDEYSRVPAEMKEVAAVLGKSVLSEITMQDLIGNAALIRSKCPDRAFLRAYHFLNETARVDKQADALSKHDMKKFLSLVNESGRSSYMYLQNVYPPADYQHESLAVGLALSEEMLKEDGAWRVHGGGFAGTIQAYVPHGKVNAYIARMESVFGKGCCTVVRIRSVGGTCIA